MTDIKPCPFCNGEAMVTMRHCDDGQPWLWKCNGPCFIERINSGPTREDAIARFNVRAQADSQAPVKLRRSIDTWRKCGPNVMARMSEAAIAYAFDDLLHDVLALAVREDPQPTIAPSDGATWMGDAITNGIAPSVAHRDGDAKGFAIVCHSLIDRTDIWVHKVFMSNADSQAAWDEVNKNPDTYCWVEEVEIAAAPESTEDVAAGEKNV